MNAPVYRSSSGYGHTARTSGRLLIDDDCLVLETLDGQMTGIAWPPGTEWDAETQTIDVEGARAGVGDTVFLDGGDFEMPADLSSASWLVAPSGRCAELDRYWRAVSLTP